MLNLLKFIVFIIVQVLWLPFTIIGLILGYVIETKQSKKYGVSFSAGQALQYRWIMHMFGTRIDKETIEFTKKFPCESHICLWLVMGPAIVCYRVLGLQTNMSKLVEPGYETLNKIAGNRVLAFDRIIEHHINHVDQVVIPGSGFDLLSQKFTKDKGVLVYEIDQTNTTKVKLETLKKAGIDHDWISYIPVDYETESWSDKLLEAGFDKTKKTLFIWQSVSLYLEDYQVDETLKMMTSLSAPGSVIAQDIYAKAFLDGSISKIATKNMDMIAKQGEPWKFAHDLTVNPECKVKDYLRKYGLQMSSYYQFGEKLYLEPFYIIVESKI